MLQSYLLETEITWGLQNYVRFVTEHTHHWGVLDVIVSNAHQYYDKAVIYPPVAPDVEGYGVASDQSVAVASQSKDTSKRSGFVRSEVRVRNKVTTKNLLSVSLHLATMSWDLLYEVDAMVEAFDTCMAKAVGNYCPEEKYVIVASSSHPQNWLYFQN